MLIFLIGFMGAGKTTAGKKLATLLKYQFIDLDEMIERESGSSLLELFEVSQQHFRDIEAKVLRKIVSANNAVISVGGGAPCYHGNMDWMNLNGVTIYIRLTVGSLFHRLAPSKHKRPLIAKKNDVELMEFIITTLQDRLTFYKQAKYIIKGENLDVKDIQELLSKGESQLK